MVVRSYVFEVRGGRVVTEFTAADANWDDRLNTADDVRVMIDLLDDVEGARDWRNLATPWKHGIALDVDGVVYGGPIQPGDFDGDSGTLKLNARGLRALLATRTILPLRAMTTPMTRKDGMPDTTLDTVLAGLDRGTIGKAVVQQAFSWPGGDVPIVYEPDRYGSRTQTYPAIDRKNLDDALSDLSGQKGGPDFRFRLGWASDRDFAWVMQSGSESRPELASRDVFAWEIGQTSGLSVRRDPSHMGSVAWSTGGRATDTAIVRMQYDPTLVDHGFPLMERDTRASTNTSEPETLDSWNAELLRTASRPWEFWSFEVPVAGPPHLRDYSVGDYIDVIVTKDAPVAGGYVAEGTYRRRIVGLSGDLSDFVTITCGEAYGDG